MTTATPSDPIQGKLYPSTKDGFAELLKDANSVYETHRLVTVLKLDKVLAAIYEERPKEAPKVGPSFFE